MNHTLYNDIIYFDNNFTRHTCINLYDTCENEIINYLNFMIKTYNINRYNISYIIQLPYSINITSIQTNLSIDNYIINIDYTIGDKNNLNITNLISSDKDNKLIALISNLFGKLEIDIIYENLQYYLSNLYIKLDNLNINNTYIIPNNSYGLDIIDFIIDNINIFKKEKDIINRTYLEFILNVTKLNNKFKRDYLINY
jgi:hypothetical protein